jgi:putative membrane protein
MSSYERFRPDDLILRDELALDRTRLANERTMLAYIRTAIMLLVSGGTILKLFGDQTGYVVAAWIIMIVGVSVAIAGSVRFLSVRKSLAHLKLLGEQEAQGERAE